jgi:hypothetical protein
METKKINMPNIHVFPLDGINRTEKGEESMRKQLTLNRVQQNI